MTDRMIDSEATTAGCVRQSSEEQCPKCGATVVSETDAGLHFECGTFAGDNGQGEMMIGDTEECLRRQLQQAEERAAVVPLLARFFTAVVDPRAHWTHCHVVPDLECWYCKHEDLIAEILTHADQVKVLAQLKAPNAPERQIQARGEVGPPSLTVESSEGDTRPLRASEGPERAFCEEGRGLK